MRKGPHRLANATVFRPGGLRKMVFFPTLGCDIQAANGRATAKKCSFSSPRLSLIFVYAVYRMVYLSTELAERTV